MNNTEQYGVIYMLYNNISQHAYIGQTVEFDNRMSGHLSDSKRRPDCLVDQKIKEYGWDNFDKLVIATGYDQNHLDELEIHYIKLYETQVKHGHGHYNITSGGCGRGGKMAPMPQNVKDKISRANKGKKRTEEEKNKRSEKYSGKGNPFFNKNHTNETKQKISHANKGKIRTDDFKKKISYLTSGSNNPNFGHGKTILIEELNIIVSGQYECARVIGIKQPAVSRALRTNRKTPNGFTLIHIKNQDDKE